MFHQSGKRCRYRRQDYVCIPDLHRLTFPEQDMTVQEMVGHYCPDQIPLFIKVTNGYCGANAVDFTFSTDETYFISHLKKQTRIVLKAETGERLSFPKNHTSRFHEIREGTIPKDSEPKCLQEILQKYCLSGGTAHVTPEEDQNIDFYIDPGRQVSFKMGKCEIETSYDERYLVANIVSVDTLTKAPCVIPHWMPITVSVAYGMTAGGQEDLTQLLQRVTAIVKNFQNSSTEGNKEIMLFQAEFDDVIGDYDTIEPTYYTRFKQQKIYSIESTCAAAGDGNATSPNITLKPPPPLTPREDDLLKVVDEPSHGSNETLNEADEDYYEEVVVLQTDSATSQTLEQNTPNKPPIYHDVTEDPDTKNVTNAGAEMSTVDRSASTDHVKPDNMLSDAFSMKNPSQQESATSKLSQNDQVANTKQMESGQAKCPPATAPKPRKEKTTSQIDSANGNGEGANSRNSDVAESADENPYSDYSRLPPPGQVHTMTVEDISDCLCVLNMPRYVDRFLKEAIDGNLLMSLDEDMLIQEFSFTPFEARKLTEFKNGWRPTTRKS